MSLVRVMVLAFHVATSQPSEPLEDTPAEPEVAQAVEAAAPLPSPRTYLYLYYPTLAPRLDCMIRGESTWNPLARSGPYVGLAQFDLATWYETPQGRAGASRTDPYASIDAMAWGVTHLGYQRWPVTSRRC